MRKILRLARVLRDRTQADTSRELQWSISKYSRVERGLEDLEFADARKLEKLLGTPAELLVLTEE